MAKLKPSTKSLILSILVATINFIAYMTFRFFGFGQVTLLEGLSYTLYVSVLDFSVVFVVSYILFKYFKI